MYLLLLVFGGLLTAAGLVLAASGISIHDHTFDTTVVTPGVVAVIGGLVLFGLGVALRVLQRIEQVLAAQPMPRALRLGEASEAAASIDPPGERARISFPPRPVARTAPRVPSGAPIAAAVPELGETQPEELPDRLPDKLPEKLPEKMPAVVQFDNTRVVEELDQSLSPRSLSPFAPSRADEDGAVNGFRAARRLGGTGSTRTAPRFDLDARGAAPSERPKGLAFDKGPAFDTVWPKGPRTLRAVQSGSVQPLAVQPASVQSAPAVKSELNSEPAVHVPPFPAAPVERPAPVSILKSGMVDGMAYTLFSDGSIEAALPQGTLRFGSITELRNHIEQNE